MTTKRRKRHTPEQIVKKLRDADAMLNAGKCLASTWYCRHLADKVPVSELAAQLDVQPSQIHWYLALC
jgi:transposase-like protein